MEEEESIGQLSLDLVVDTTKATEQIQALASSSSSAIAVVVDQSQLHDLNKTIDSKLKHIAQLRAEAAKKISFAVELPKVDQLLAPPILNRQGTIVYEATVNYRDIEKSIASAVERGIESSSRSIGKALASELKKSSASGGPLRNAIDGIGLGIGQSLGSYTVRSLKKNAGIDLNKLVDQSIGGIAAPVKLFFTENDQLKTQLASTSKSISDRLRKASYGLADGIIEALDARSSTIQQRINLIIKRATPDITEQAKGAYAEALASAPGYRDALVNGTTASGPLGAFDRGLRARREAAIKERAIPLVRERAAEILNSGKKINTGNAVTPQTENLVVAVGGYAGARGLSGKRLVGMVQQQAGPSDQVIWVKNTESDIPKEAMGKASSKAMALATSLAKPNLRGYSKDAVEAASQAISALERNPKLNVKFLGESGGTYVAEEAAKILQMMGYGNASYLGVGGPDFIGRLNAKGKKIISPDEYLGAENARLYGRLGLSRAKKGSQQLLGVGGHPYEHYSDAMPAELGTYLKSKPARLSKSELSDIRAAATQFSALDLAALEPKQLETISKQAYKNMQLMRQQIQVAAKENIGEISKISKIFEQVYVRSAPESKELSQARELATKAKALLIDYRSSPGLKSAMDAAVVAREVGQVQAELKKLYAPAVGTNKLKYESIYQDLESTREALSDPKLGVKGYKAKSKIETVSVLPTEKPGAIALPINGLKEKAITLTAQTANLLVTGVVKVAGGALSAAHGAEQAILGRGGAKVVNTIGAAVGLSQLPGGTQAIGMLGDAAGGLAHLPLSQFAGMSAEAITGLITNSLSAAPILKGLAPQISAAISQALAGGAAGASALVGDIAGPLLAGAGALKLGGAAAKQLPGYNAAAGQRVAGNVESFMISAMRDRKIASAKAGPQNKALPPGSEILDAELIEDAELLLKARNVTALPASKPKPLPGRQVFALPARTELKLNENISLGDSVGIAREIERIKSSIKVDKANILAKLKSNDPEIIEQGLVQAGVLGHGVGILSGDLRRIKDSARAQRQVLKEQNPQIKKTGNIPGYSDLLKTERAAEGLLATRKGTLKGISDRIEILGADKSLLPKISPRLVTGVAGAGAFASVMAALTTGAQAATIGGGAIASGGLAVPLIGLLGALGIGGLGVAAGAKYKKQPLKQAFGDVGDFLKSPLYSEPEEGGEPVLRPQFARFKNLFRKRTAAVQNQISTEQVEAAKEAAESNEAEKLGGPDIKAQLTGPFKNLAGRGVQALLGFMALNLILPVGSALVGGLISSAKKAMEDIKAERLISSVLGAKGVSEARASAASLASKYGVNQREYLQDSSKLSLSLQGTTLEGQGNYLAESLGSTSVLKGLDAEKRRRIALVYSQVAGKNQFYAEEAQQLAEVDPSGTGDIAASAGLSVQQFRQLQTKGQIGPDVLLSNAARQKATALITGNALANDPEARINKLGDSIDQLQVKVGKGALGPLASSADIASAGVKFLTENLELLLKIGSAALLALVSRGVLATGVFKGLSAAMQTGGGFAATAKSTAGAIGNIGGQLLAANAPALAFTAAVVLAGDAISSVGDMITGDKNPFRALRLSTEEATTALGKYLDRLNEVNKGGGVKTDTRTLREKVDTFRKKEPNFVDNVADFLFDDVPIMARPFTSGGKGSFLGQTGASQAKDDLNKFALDSTRREAQRKNILDQIAEQEPQIDNKKLELVRLQTEQAANTGLDRSSIEANNKRQLQLRAEINQFEELSQAGNKFEEEFRKSLKVIVDSDILAAFPEMKDTLAALNKEQQTSIETQDKLTRSANAQTLAASRIQFAIENLSATYGNAQSKLARDSITQSTELTTRFTGSLLTGLKAALEMTNQIATLSKTLSIQKTALASTQQQLANPLVANQVTTLQGLGRLPANLADTTDKQLEKLSKDKAISDNTKELILKYKELTSAIATTTKDKAEAIAKQREVVLQENKAAKESLENTTLEFNKSLATSQQASRDLVSANLSGKFKESLTGFNSSVSSHFSNLIDEFEQAGELTRIETDRRKQQFDIEKERLSIDRDYVNRNNSLSSPNVEGYSSPVPGLRLKDALNIPRRPVEQPDAKRDRNRDGVPERHNAIDIPQEAGAANQALASGLARVIDYRTKRNPGFGVAIEIEFIGPDGQALKVRQGHLDPESVFKAIGLRPGGGTTQVRSGQKLGVVSDLNLSTQGIRNHVDYKFYQNGKIIEDPTPLLQRMAVSGKGVDNLSPTNRNGQKGSNSSVVGSDQFTPVNASFYYPGKGDLAMEGGAIDFRGRKLTGDMPAIATRTTDSLGGLPDGAVVEFRDPRTKKTTRAVVRDRGPLFEGRDVDLTPAVAAGLGIKSDGIAGLEIRVISTPSGKVADSYDLGVGNGRYDKKGRYTGKYGKKITGARSKYRILSPRADANSGDLLLAYADLGVVNDSGVGLLAQSQYPSYQQSSPKKASGANSGHSFTTPSVGFGDSLINTIDRLMFSAPTKPYNKMSPAELAAEYKRLQGLIAAGQNGSEISKALATVIGLMAPPIKKPKPTRAIIVSPSLDYTPPAQIPGVSRIPKVQGASGGNGSIPVAGDIGASLLDSLLPGAQYNRSLPQPSGNAATDLAAANSLNMADLQRRSADIDQAARQSTELKQFQLRAKTRKTDREKLRKTREEARTQSEAAGDAEDALIATREDTPERAKLQANRARLKTSRANQQKIEEDIITYNEEIKELEILKDELTQVNASLLNPEQRQIIKRLRDNITPGISLLKKYRATAGKLKIAYGVAANMQAVSIGRDFLREESRRIGEAGDAANNERANLLRANLAKVQEFQKRNPYDLSQGDELEMKREADKIGLQTTFNADKQSITANLRKATDNPVIKAKLEAQLKTRKLRFSQEMQNIDTTYTNEVKKRSEDYNRYLGEQARNIQNLSITDRKALLEGIKEGERLNPQYRADLVNLDYGIRADEERLRNQQQLDAILKKRQEDKTKKGQANADREEAAEAELHFRRMGAIEVGRQNALIESDASRRQLDLARRRSELESRSGLIAAGAAYLSAGGYETRATTVQREQERLARELQRDEQLNAITELRAKQQLTQEQADTRSANLLSQFDLTERASALAYKRQQDSQQFGLGQGFGSLQAERLQAQGASLGSFGNTYDQQTNNRDAALLSDRLSIAAKLRDFDEQALRYDGDQEALDILTKTRAEYEALSKVRLDNVSQEYNRFGRVVKDTSANFGNVIDKLLTGQSVSGDDWTGLLLAPLRAFSNIIGNYLNSIVSQFLNNMLKPLLGDLDKELGKAPSAQQNGNALSFTPPEQAQNTIVPSPRLFFEHSSAESPNPLFDHTLALSKIAGSNFILGAGEETELDSRIAEIGAALMDKTATTFSHLLEQKALLIETSDGPLDGTNAVSSSGSRGGNDFGSSLINGLGGLAKNYLVGAAGGSKSLGGGLLSAGLGLLGGLVGFADGGIVNPHLPPSRTDNRIVKVRDGEAYITPEAVKGIGGASAIRHINKTNTLPPMGFDVGFKQISERSYSTPPVSNPRPMTIEYRDVGGLPMVTQEQLELALLTQTQQMQKQQRDLERSRLDRQTHSVTYRQQTRGGI
jgi:tape measure domain-containing protein